MRSAVVTGQLGGDHATNGADMVFFQGRVCLTHYQDLYPRVEQCSAYGLYPYGVSLTAALGPAIRRIQCPALIKKHLLGVCFPGVPFDFLFYAYSFSLCHFTTKNEPRSNCSVSRTVKTWLMAYSRQAASEACWLALILFLELPRRLELPTCRLQGGGSTN